MADLSAIKTASVDKSLIFAHSAVSGLFSCGIRDYPLILVFFVF